MKNKFDILGLLWVTVLFVAAFLIIITVNLGFYEKTLKEELIVHTAITAGVENVCVCGICGGKGLAYCMHCGSPMKWGQPLGHFICPNCKSVGLPQCPKCNVSMFGMVKTKKNSNVIMSGTPIPIY